MCLIMNSKDLTEAEQIKKKWQEYAAELYKNGLNDLDNNSGVVIHLELDILECEVKWALGNRKLSSGHRTGKGQFSLQSQGRVMPKNVQTTAQLHSFHILARLCSKSFKLGFSST